ncbi:MAG: helix-turn-helix domain-containing protein [Polyangiaceae bacterium]|nr:helix-turn-helix domain-containing protein [Polyangiaceae bacterium]
MRIDVLVLDGVFDLGLAALLDTLKTANELAPNVPGPRVRFDVRTLGLRGDVHTALGFRVPVVALKQEARASVVLLPALGCKTPETICEALERSDVSEACAWLRQRYSERARLLAACTGTFVLAETGLLDGGSATTTWWLGPTFRKRFPEVKLDDSTMVVENGRCVTAGAALAHLDLALWLVRSKSPTLATLVSRYLLVEARSTPALHAIPDQLAHADPLVEAFERWARGHIAEQLSVEDAARAIGTSVRTLARRTQRVLGRSPLGFVQDLRVEQAIHRLRTTDASVDDIAREVGYLDGVTLRNLLRKKTGRGVRELRRLWPD